MRAWYWQRPYTSIPRPHWSPSSPTLAEYLKELAKSSNAPSASSLDSRANRLRYYYIHTLGCPNTFDLQRAEIALQTGRRVVSVSEEEVVKAVLGDVLPNGAIRQVTPWLRVVRFTRD